MSIKNKIGYRIREIRNRTGISQETLAHLAGLDRTYINSVENGKRNISVVNIEKIAIALEISVRNFFDSELFEKSENKVP